MTIFLALGGGVCWLFAAWVWIAPVVRTDIQIGIAVTALIGGLILFGMAYIVATGNELLKRLPPK